MRRLRKLLALTSDERRILVKAAFWLSVVQLALGRVRFATLRRLVTRAGRNGGRLTCDREIADRVVWAVTVASRYAPGRTTCLTRALTVQGMLARLGYPSRLHVGVIRGQQGAVDGHAWVECAGRILIGGTTSEIGQFTPLAAFDVEATVETACRRIAAGEPMSAVAGLYRTDGRPVNRHEVDRMVLALAHRGPDGTGAWSGGPVALAHGALWTTPESRGEPQPLASAACNVIVADARLDNRRDLLAALGLSGSAAGEIGDSELILRAYERWGEACATKLIGDFAFAIWDSQNQSLFCARDHVGVKPFYYHQSSSAFLFASEIKALLTSPIVPYRLNPSRVADYLVGLFDDQAITFYRDVYRLPAGHTLTVTRSGTRIRSLLVAGFDPGDRAGVRRSLRGSISRVLHRGGALPAAQQSPCRLPAERRPGLVVHRGHGSAAPWWVRRTPRYVHGHLPEPVADRPEKDRRASLRRRGRGAGRPRGPLRSR